MPRSCVAAGCTNHDMMVGDQKKSFFEFPKRKIDSERRDRWLSALLRDNEDGSKCSPPKSRTLCSDHFVTASIEKIPTSGASEDTAKQDKLSMQGVDASMALARTDLQRVNQYRSAILSAAQNNQVHPAVIAAIISRETRGGSPYVMKDGWGDFGNAYGLMQVDKRYHTPRGDWNSLEHLNQGTSILAEFTEQIRAKFPNWSREQQLKGGIAAYNCGVNAVASYEAIDSRTTGGDYSNDVVARAKFFLRNGYN